MDRQNAEVCTDFLQENGTLLEFHGNLPKNLLLVWILRGFQIRRLDDLEKDEYQKEESKKAKGYQVGYGGSSGKGYLPNKGIFIGLGGGSSEGIGFRGSCKSTIRDRYGDGEGPLPGSVTGNSSRRFFQLPEIRRVTFPLFSTRTPEIQITEISLVSEDQVPPLYRFISTRSSG